MPEYGLIARLAELSRPDSWKIEKKIGVLAFQKELKLVIHVLEKKSPMAGDINYVRYLRMQKANDHFTPFEEIAFNFLSR